MGVEIKALQGFVLLLVLVGMILGIGVLTLDKFGTATKTTTSVTDASVNVSSGSATLSKTYCLAVSSISNATGATTWDAATYNVSFTDTDTCAITSDLPVSILYNVSFTYAAASSTSDTLVSTRDAITPVASTWLPLIVTVFVLAIILSLVIGSFAGKQR